MSSNLYISSDVSKVDIDKLHRWLQKSHWAKNRSCETIEKSLKHSLCFAAYELDQMVAFARVVTDYSTFAYLCDVIVDENYRGRGISKLLMQEIMKHSDLQSLRRFVLATKDAHGLYEKYGFRTFTDQESQKFMSILREDV